MSEKRHAIIFGGSSYNVRYSLKSQLENLIIPNDADVFIVTTRYCKRRHTEASEIPEAWENDKWNEKNAGTMCDFNELTSGEINLIKETFGDRLKVFYIAEDDTDYMNYLKQKRIEMANIVNWYIDESVHLKLPLPFTGTKFANPNNDSSNGTIRCIVDQYNHIKKCYELMEKYENENGFKYDWVMRARIDFIVPFEFNMAHYYLNHDKPYLYICGNIFVDDVCWCDEFCWFSKRETASKLFPQLSRMGMITERKYSTTQFNNYAPNGNDLKFDPEIQFGILLKEIGFNNIIPLKIYRSAQYTNDGEYDYFNYKFRREIDLNYEYKLVCECETDINQHIPKLREYAEKCDTIIELGTRYGNSTIGFMAARKKFIAYDTQWNPKIDYLKLIGKESESDFEMKIENPTPEDGESLLSEHDLLFVDTNHHARQCSLELKLHAPKTKKYIIFHDTTSFWSGLTGGQGGEAGLQYAIEPFLAEHPEWQIEYRSYENNGLMILKRINEN